MRLKLAVITRTALSGRGEGLKKTIFLKYMHEVSALT
jgi:hypothetical protein